MRNYTPSIFDGLLYLISSCNIQAHLFIEIGLIYIIFPSICERAFNYPFYYLCPGHYRSLYVCCCFETTQIHVEKWKLIYHIVYGQIKWAWMKKRMNNIDHEWLKSDEVKMEIHANLEHVWNRYRILTHFQTLLLLPFFVYHIHKYSVGFPFYCDYLLCFIDNLRYVIQNSSSFFFLYVFSLSIIVASFFNTVKSIEDTFLLHNNLFMPIKWFFFQYFF